MAREFRSGPLRYTDNVRSSSPPNHDVINKGFYDDSGCYMNRSGSDTSGYFSDHMLYDDSHHANKSLPAVPVEKRLPVQNLSSEMDYDMRRQNHKLKKVKRFMYGIIKDLGQDKSRSLERSRSLDRSCDNISTIAQPDRKPRKQKKSERKQRLFSVDDWNGYDMEPSPTRRHTLDNSSRSVGGRVPTHGDHVQNTNWQWKNNRAQTVGVNRPRTRVPVTSLDTTYFDTSVLKKSAPPCDRVPPVESVHYASTDVTTQKHNVEEEHIYETIPHDHECFSPEINRSQRTCTSSQNCRPRRGDLNIHLDRNDRNSSPVLQQNPNTRPRRSDIQSDIEDRQTPSPVPSLLRDSRPKSARSALNSSRISQRRGSDPPKKVSFCQSTKFPEVETDPRSSLRRHSEPSRNGQSKTFDSAKVVPCQRAPSPRVPLTQNPSVIVPGKNYTVKDVLESLWRVESESSESESDCSCVFSDSESSDSDDDWWMPPRRKSIR